MNIKPNALLLALCVTLGVALNNAAVAKESISLPAITQAWQSSNLYSRSTGTVDKVLVDVGDFVEKDQLLARVKDPLILAEHQRLSAEIASAKAELKLNQLELSRAKELVGKNLITQSELDRLAFFVNKSIASIKALEAELTKKDAQVAFLNITAPFDGFITQRNIDVGDLVAKDNVMAGSLFTVEDLSQLRLVFHIPQHELSRFSAGLPVRFAVANADIEALHSKIRVIVPMLNRKTGTMRGEALLPNDSYQIPAGMRGEVGLLEQGK